MVYEIKGTKQFNQWLKGLKDRATKSKVLARLARVENGNFGDHKPISKELFELRLFFAGESVLLLNGGGKSSQSKDIEKAKTLLSELE